MAVLNNTGIRAGASAATSGSGDEGYQITKSLRLNYWDQPLITHDPKRNGNPRTFTYAFWVKINSAEPTHPYFFAGDNIGASNYFLMRHKNGGVVNHEGRVNIYWHDGTAAEQVDTTAYIRDSSAWLHIVYSIDTTQATEADRYKIYLNGIRETALTLSNGGYPPRNEKLSVSIAKTQQDFFSWNGGSNLMGNVADVFWIDGLALPPEAFGKFDADNVWQPIDFHKPSPNAGVTWSGLWSLNTGTFDQAITKAFDGTIASGANAARSSANSAIATMDLSSNKIDVKSSIELYGNTTSPGYSHQFWVTVGDTEYTFVADKGNHKFHVSGELTQIKVQNDHPDGRTMIEGILVDGVLLEDGVTDTNWATWSAHDTVNLGENHGGEVTSETGSFYGSNVAANLFDGRHQVDGGAPTNVDASSSGKWVKWTPEDPIAFNTKVEVAVASNDNTISLKRVGVGSTDDITTSGGASTWKTVYTGSGQIEYITNSAPGGGYNNWEAIKVDGVILTEYKRNENSFNLKFADSSSKETMTKDYLKGKISEATGGLPIYKTKAGTTDNSIDYGDVKDTGYRADSSAGSTDGTGLVYALPGDVLNGDVHHLIKSVGSKKLTTVNGNPYIDTVHSRFYGSSINNDYTADYLDVDGGTDFNFGTGDYTIECWFRTTDNTRNQGIFVLSNTAKGLATDESSHITCHMDTNGLNVRPGDGTDKQILAGSDKPANYKWYHLAYVRQSGVFKVYLDGTCHFVQTDTTNHADQYLAIGGYYSTSYLFEGNIQDFRVYKGVAKYTTGFIAPNRTDFTSQGLDANNPGSGNIDYISTGSAAAWKTIYNGGDGVIESLKCDSSHDRSTQNYQNWYGVRIDGTHLNESGTEYSEDVTSSTGSYYGTSTPAKLFDGDESTNVDASSGGGWVKWTPDGGHAFADKIEVLHNPGNDSQVFTLKLKSAPEKADICNDSPVNSGTDTGAGGEVTGNYCVLDAEDTGNKTLGLKISEAGLRLRRNLGTINDTSGITYGSFLLPKTGKWYWEVRVPANDTIGGNTYAGITCHELTHGSTNYTTHIGKGMGTQLKHSASKTIWTDNSTSTVDMGAWVEGDWIGFAFDGVAQTLKVYKGGALKHTWSSITMTNRSWKPAISQSGYGSEHGYVDVNFGARPFANNAPADHVCLCTQNLSDIVTDDNKASSGFEAVAYDGQQRDWNIKDVGFKPAFAWIKEWNDGQNHQLYDVTRGTANNYKRYELNTTDVQETKTDGVKTFNTDGVTIGGNVALNETDKEYNMWLWNAGASAATASTEGDITPNSQWVNKDYGFSVTQWTGGGGVKTIGHGLDKAPEFFMGRNLESSSATMNTFVYHHSLGPTQQLFMNTTGAMSGDWFNDAAPDADVWTMGDTGAGNENGGEFIGYLWHSIPGFSAFGSYEGNDSATLGPKINVGFKPALIFIKNADWSTNWEIFDLHNRIAGNPHESILSHNLSGAISTSANNAMDIYSNGFKPFNNTTGNNDPNLTYVYACWAENPFKTARAI